MVLFTPTILLDCPKFCLVCPLSVVQSLSYTHGLQHTMLPCPSLSPRVCSNSCPSSQWCHPTISSSVVPFSSCLQSFPATGFFSNESALCIRWPKCWSFSFSISPSNEYSGLVLLGLTGLISLLFKGPSRVFSNTTVQKHLFFSCSTLFMIQLSHP